MFFCACSQAPQGPTAEVADSAGVRIVQYSGIEGGQPWQVDATSSLTLRRSSGDIDLFQLLLTG